MGGECSMDSGARLSRCLEDLMQELQSQSRHTTEQAGAPGLAHWGSGQGVQQSPMWVA